jgi:hypothetical protein
VVHDPPASWYWAIALSYGIVAEAASVRNAVRNCNATEVEPAVNTGE